MGIWRAITRRWTDLPGSLYESAIITEIRKLLNAPKIWPMSSAAPTISALFSTEATRSDS